MALQARRRRGLRAEWRELFEMEEAIEQPRGNQELSRLRADGRELFEVEEAPAGLQRHRAPHLRLETHPKLVEALAVEVREVRLALEAHRRPEPERVRSREGLRVGGERGRKGDEGG